MNYLESFATISPFQLPTPALFKKIKVKYCVQLIVLRLIPQSQKWDKHWKKNVASSVLVFPGFSHGSARHDLYFSIIEAFRDTFLLLSTECKTLILISEKSCNFAPNIVFQTHYQILRLQCWFGCPNLLDVLNYLASLSRPAIFLPQFANSSLVAP